MLFRLVKNGQTVTGGDLTTGNTAASADITGLDYDGVNIGIQVNPGISIDANAYPMVDIGAEAMPYTPYAAMGGGTIGLASPLYGLPDAEDIAEMGVDGEVLVTRRTAVKTLDGTEEWSDGFSITSTGGLHFTACAIGDIRGAFQQ